MKQFKINEKDTTHILQNIWEKHIDIQEQLLLSRAIPISIISDSAKIIGQKLYLTVDKDNKTNKILDEIASIFHLSLEDLVQYDFYFLADKTIAVSVEKSLKEELSRKGAVFFINFLPNPIIDGFIKQKHSPINRVKSYLEEIGAEFSFDKNNRLQISLNHLKNINSQKINIIFPEKANIILSIRPNPIFYLKRLFPNVDFQHKIIKYNNDNKVSYNYFIEVIDKYITNQLLRQLENDIDLSLCFYDYIFYINPNVISKYDPESSGHVLPKFDSETNSFTFRTYLEKSSNEVVNSNNYDEERKDFKIKYDRLKKFFNFYFGEENVTFKTKFVYKYNKCKFDTNFLSKQKEYPIDFWEQVYNSIGTEENISVSQKSNVIGIDFNWKEENIDDILMYFNERCSSVNFSYYGKKHKCNIDFQVQNISLDDIEQNLRDCFPSIHIKKDNKEGKLYFYQEYQTLEQSYNLKSIIEEELKALNLKGFDYGLYSTPKNKKKYFLEIDIKAKNDSEEFDIKNLRGTVFGAKDKCIGKLLKVNYPDLIFDISDITDNILNTINAVSCIEPDITGELEKIKRLKKSFNDIKDNNNNNLQNPNLREFIFNANKAKIIDDIEYHINPQSETFHELENHLLNTKINNSQKQAIIKTLLAKDLALIQGPPGTGKSTAIAEIIWQHIRNKENERILLTSETNLAVDNAINRIVNNNHNLVKPIRIAGEDKLEPEGKQFSLDIMKQWVECEKIEDNENDEEQDKIPQKIILQNWIENIKKRIDKTALGNEIFAIWNSILSNPTRNIREIFYNNYKKYCNLIGATCSSIGKLNSKGKWTGFYRYYQEIFGEKENIVFTTVIQDESSKATPAELVLPLVYGKKSIIIGDHRQLPPLLDREEFITSFDFLSANSDREELEKIEKMKKYILNHFNEMEISHFQRLFENIDNSLKGIFNLQYRMHPDINDVIKQFYITDGGLECGLTTPHDLGVDDTNMKNSASRYHGINIPNFISENNHVVWIDTFSPEMIEGTSRINYGEVEVIRKVLTKFQNSDSFKQYQSFWDSMEEQQIGLISFYGKQINLLRNLRKEFKDIPIRVSTVDRFQGMERNIIIVSMVRSNCIASDIKQRPDIKLYGELGFPEQRDLGFAQSPNRLNVALSRAKRLLIIVGNSKLFRQKEIYDNVYQTIANNPNGKIIKYDTL